MFCKSFEFFNQINDCHLLAEQPVPLDEFRCENPEWPEHWDTDEIKISQK